MPPQVRGCRFSLLLFLCVAFGRLAGADSTLVGSQVTGLLNMPPLGGNLFDPNNGGFWGPPLPFYLNSAGTTVTISESAPEFGFGSAPLVLAANFTSTTLTILNLQGIITGENNTFHLVFVDQAFLSFSVTLDSVNYPGMTYSLVGNTLTIDQPPFTLASPLTANFTFHAVPEGNTVLLIAIGVAGLCGRWCWARRRTII